jgi:hypothetical protein
MYLKPESTASVTITASGPRRSAGRCAPTTFAPRRDAGEDAFLGREAPRHLDRRAVLDRLDVIDAVGVPLRHHRSRPALHHERARLAAADRGGGRRLVRLDEDAVRT